MQLKSFCSSETAFDRWPNTGRVASCHKIEIETSLGDNLHNDIQDTISAFWLVKNMSINPKSVQKSVIEFENDWQLQLLARTNKMADKN